MHLIWRKNIIVYLDIDSYLWYSSRLQASGSGFPSRNDLNSKSDLSGCVAGAKCEAPLMLANDRELP